MKSKICEASLGGLGELQQQSERVNPHFPTYTEHRANYRKGQGRSGEPAVLLCPSETCKAPQAGARCHLESAPHRAPHSSLGTSWGRLRARCCGILPLLPRDWGQSRCGTGLLQGWGELSMPRAACCARCCQGPMKRGGSCPPNSQPL